MSLDQPLEPEMAVEAELKLALDAVAMRRLLRSGTLRGHARGPLRSRQLHAIYYDTPDSALRARRVVLRVRRVGRRYVQTLKAAPADNQALLVRGEWEVSVAGWQPRLDAFTDPAALDLLADLGPGELRPVFETRFRRRTLLLEWPDGEGQPAEIELAFDEGRIVAGELEAPLCELELELKRGRPSLLFTVAEAMREVVAFRIEPLEKAARGWLLATGTRPAARKAAAIRLAPEQPVDEVLAEVLGAALRHWLENEPAALGGEGMDGVHQLRVSLRRLRSALTLFRPAIGAGQGGAWSDELRWLLGHLGAVRDLDVLTGSLLPPLVTERGGDEGLRAFERLAVERRAVARADMQATLRSARYADLALRFAAWTARAGWRHGADAGTLGHQQEAAASFAAAVLAKRYRAVRKRGRRFRQLDPEARHQLRIALKKLRYGIDFFAELYPGKRAKRFHRKLIAMQERLGHLNDVAVAGRLVEHLLALAPPGHDLLKAAIGGGTLLGRYAQQLDDREPETSRAWKAFRKLKPFWDTATNPP